MRGQGHWSDLLPEEALSREEASRVLRRLWRMLKPYYGSIAVASVLVVAQAGALLGGPYLVKYGIDHGLPNPLTHSSGDASKLNLAVVVYLALALLGFVLGRAVTMLIARIGEDFLRMLRAVLFRHLMSLSMGFFEREPTGKLVARMTSDIDALQELISQGLVLMIQNVLLFVGAVVLVFLLSWQLALGVVVIVPPVYFASRWFRRVSNAAYLEVRDRIAVNMSTLQESLEGIRVVQAFAREGEFAQRFHGTNEDQYQANLRTVKISAKYFPAVEFTGVLGTAVILGYGGYLVHQDVITLGTVAAFVLYLNNLFEPIQQLSQFYNVVQSAGAALQKIFTLLDTQPTVAERAGAFDLPSGGTSSLGIDVNHVSFAYTRGGDTVLHDVTLSVAPGERVALVGPTGAGKSTLAKLMSRFYDPVEGSVHVGGVDLRDVTLASLHQRLCVVPQEGYLFAGTLRDNVRIGRVGSSDAEVERALAALGILERFVAFPDGLDTEVREGGRGSRPASDSSSRSRAPRSPIPRCSCSTRRRRTSIPAPSTRSSRRSSRSWRAARSSSWRTASRPRRVPTASPSSTTAASPSSVPTTSSCTRVAATPGSTRAGSLGASAHLTRGALWNSVT
jgi:ATP-binding cassette subfamily B protein